MRCTCHTTLIGETFDHFSDLVPRTLLRAFRSSKCICRELHPHTDNLHIVVYPILIPCLNTIATLQPNILHILTKLLLHNNQIMLY